MNHTIAIIVAGFSGTAGAVHLLTSHGHMPFEVVLVNRHDEYLQENWLSARGERSG
jgi:NADH dehydrogenase FAD-containing subunit